MKTIFTAIFGNYDDLKEPLRHSYVNGWKMVCFTDQEIQSDHWQIFRVPVMDCGPIKTARYYKIMYYKHILTEYSMWIDATFFINTNLDEFWLNNFTEPFTTMRHPFDDCIYKDVKSCINGKKDNVGVLTNQGHLYSRLGIPKNNGLIASGILLRQNTPEVRDLCRLWWEQVKAHSTRDQIAFGYASWRKPGVHRFMPFNYTRDKQFIHLPHKNRPWREQRKIEILKEYGEIQGV